MKVIFREGLADYDSYSFGYSVLAQIEPQDSLSHVYNQGFLPYSSELDLPADHCYLCRNVRVNLADFSFGSENRRVGRKLGPLELTVTETSMDEFDTDDPVFRKFCKTYAEAKFSNKYLDDARLDYMFSHASGTDIATWKNADGQPVAYVFLGQDQEIAHYWYAFYDLQLGQEFPLGKYLMQSSVKRAQEKGQKYMYLGTCYGTKPLYKIRDFSGVEYFTGQGWSADIQALKALCYQDES
ncbi:MAG: GNAT family N-acetyltransferase [Bacteroidota bacterium]